MNGLKIIKLDLIHSVHGVVRSHYFQLYKPKDTRKVLQIVNRWRQLYGPKYLQCTTEWDLNY